MARVVGLRLDDITQPTTSLLTLEHTDMQRKIRILVVEDDQIPGRAGTKSMKVS